MIKLVNAVAVAPEFDDRYDPRFRCPDCSGVPIAVGSDSRGTTVGTHLVLAQKMIHTVRAKKELHKN